MEYDLEAFHKATEILRKEKEGRWIKPSEIVALVHYEMSLGNFQEANRRVAKLLGFSNPNIQDEAIYLLDLIREEKKKLKRIPGIDINDSS